MKRCSLSFGRKALRARRLPGKRAFVRRSVPRLDDASFGREDLGEKRAFCGLCKRGGGFKQNVPMRACRHYHNCIYYVFI